jgi:hypothetical protein
MRMLAARATAFGIAALAVVDPAVTSSRSSRPLVAVVSTDVLRNPALTDRVIEALERRFTVVRGMLDGVAATVIVGQRLPDELTSDRTPLVAVLPEDRQSIRIVNVRAPATAPLHTRVPVEVTVEARGARGRDVSAWIQSGNLMVDEKRLLVDSDTARLSLTTHYVAPNAGPHTILAAIRLDGSSAADSTLTVVDVRDERLEVLFHDQRPAWASTFVRRAVEQDPRFSVSHRVLTSRGLSNSSGVAPRSLGEGGRLDALKAIVIGAPEQLTDADVAGLDEFMRRRGGRVVLLLEGASGGRAIERLTGVARWRSTRMDVTAPITSAAGVEVLRGKELVWPAELPAVSELHASSVARDSTRRALVWSVPVGAGRLLVSGAIDAWHRRDAASGFDEFWTSALAKLAAAAPGLIEVDVSPASAAPGQTATVRVTLRDAFLSAQDVRASRVSARLLAEGESMPVRLWPEIEPGVFTGRIVAPRQVGTHRLIVSSASDSTTAPIVVDARARRSSDDDRQFIEAFASSRGGFVASEYELRALPGRLSSAIRAMPRVESWHPMRSPWWIVPFALLLGAEWWSRRRRGLA